MTNHRVSRGRASQEILAAWFRSKGWTGAQSRPASLPGTDIMGMLGLAPEVKATGSLDITGGLRQASKNAGSDLPFLVYRPKGYGPERVAEWPVFLTVRDFTALLLEAGYGA